jgi:hypothetical protein
MLAKQRTPPGFTFFEEALWHTRRGTYYPGTGNFLTIA